MDRDAKHGAAPDIAAQGGAALLIIDMMNALDFEGGDALRRRLVKVVPAVETLRDAADAADVPVIYVNDNFGLWRSDTSEIVAHCMRKEAPGRRMAARLHPRAQDYFVVKPRFSGFYATTLPVLLPKLGVSRLILCGVAADMCVLFTAADAHMREYALWIPSDAVASDRVTHRDWALGIMEKAMGAETRATSRLKLADWISRPRA